MSYSRDKTLFYTNFYRTPAHGARADMGGLAARAHGSADWPVDTVSRDAQAIEIYHMSQRPVIFLWLASHMTGLKLQSDWDV